MNFEYIHQFLVLTETCSFSKAASKLFISPSTLSRHIALLEQEYDAVFLERTTRNVELTPLGKEARDVFRDIYSRNQDLENLIQIYKGEKKNVLKVGLYHYCFQCNNIILSVLQKWNQGEVEIRYLSAYERWNELLNGNLDMILTPKNNLTGADSILFYPYSACPVSVLMSSDHPLAGKRILSVEDIINETIILPVDDPYLDNISQIFVDDNKISPEKTIEAEHLEVIPFLIKDTRNIFLMPTCYHFLINDGVVAVPYEHTMDYYIAYRKDNQNPLLQKAMKEILASKQ